AILAEYSGAVLGVLSAVLYGRRGHLWKKVGGLVAMLASFYFLSEGWAMATHSPFYILSKSFQESEGQTEHVLDLKSMISPILAGILSALRRVIARRISLKNQLKRRLHAITIASATCFLFPVAMWDMIVHRRGKVAYGFLLSKTYNGCRRMLNFHGNYLQDGLFISRLFGLLHSLRLWYI
nr:zinc transporter 5 [Tanacetum cinerariifolium]